MLYVFQPDNIDVWNSMPDSVVTATSVTVSRGKLDCYNFSSSCKCALYLMSFILFLFKGQLFFQVFLPFCPV